MSPVEECPHRGRLSGSAPASAAAAGLGFEILHAIRAARRALVLPDGAKVLGEHDASSAVVRSPRSKEGQAGLAVQRQRFCQRCRQRPVPTWRSTPPMGCWGGCGRRDVAVDLKGASNTQPEAHKRGYYVASWWSAWRCRWRATRAARERGHRWLDAGHRRGGSVLLMMTESGRCSPPRGARRVGARRHRRPGGGGGGDLVCHLLRGAGIRRARAVRHRCIALLVGAADGGPADHRGHAGAGRPAT